MLSVMVIWLDCTLNLMRLGKEVTCIYYTLLKKLSRHVTLAILAFGFLDLVVVDAPRFLVVKEDTV
jgi:hypothetical protein